MNRPVLFEERQGYQQKWLRQALFCCTVLALILLLVRWLVADFADLKEIIFVLILVAAIAVFILNIRLQTIITEKGIYVRYFPFNTRYKYIAWDSVKSCSIRHYNPIAEYGGWGIKMSVPENGWAYNFSGTEGIQLTFFDNTKLLIGTNCANEIRVILQQLGVCV